MPDLPICRKRYEILEASRYYVHRLYLLAIY
jgi:hypothetical protein